jgi:hypothetical protein
MLLAAKVADFAAIALPAQTQEFVLFGNSGGASSGFSVLFGGSNLLSVGGGINPTFGRFGSGDSNGGGGSGIGVGYFANIVATCLVTRGRRPGLRIVRRSR